VASGIALYLGTDPALIRLIFLALFFAGGFGLVLYVICWIALPGSSNLAESTPRRLYRDPDNKMLGGVASGLGHYFGIDYAIIRIIFLALVFAGGFSIILYILLWIVLPEARTITEKVQMRGGPITLSSIEESVKNGLNMKDENGEETPLARAILLPVRLIAQLINGLAKILGPILILFFEIIRIVAGVLLIIISTSLLFACIVGLLVGLGWVQDESIFLISGMPASVFFNGIPHLGVIAGFLTGIIPAIFLFILAVGLLTKRFFLRGSLGWPLFAVWLVSVFTVGGTAIYMANQFGRSGEYVQEQILPVAPFNTLVLELNETGGEFTHSPRMEIQGHTGPNVRVIQRVTAKGRTEEAAIAHAQMVSYRVVQRDSLIRFNDSYEFGEGAVYRDQRLNLVIMLPENKTYRISRNMARRLRSTAFTRDYSWEEISRHAWQVRNDRFECLTCPPQDTAAAAPVSLSFRHPAS
jgi:phage shock protein PspC (stress-responsive transcriptional regulator)